MALAGPLSDQMPHCLARLVRVADGRQTATRCEGGPGPGGATAHLRVRVDPQRAESRGVRRHWQVCEWITAVLGPEDGGAAARAKAGVEPEL